MLISSITEMNALLPSNVSSESDRWLTLMEQTERNYIVPLLGKPLYDKVQEEYKKICRGEAEDKAGLILPDAEALTSTQPGSSEYQYTPMQELIRLIQVPLVYMTLANNAGMLAVSLNDAGMNVTTADNYDTAKKEDREAFARDCYLNAHKGLEQVLLFLEEDARSEEPVFVKEWMKSTTFYQQNGLLLRTAKEYNRYVDIGESRETYLSLIPTILRFQDNRIRPVLGDRLTNAFIQYMTFGQQPKPAEGEETVSDVNTDSQPDNTEETESDVPSWEKVTSSMTSEEAFDEDLRMYLPYRRYEGMTSGERYKIRSWNKALTLISSALAYYVEDAVKKLHRNSSLDDAMSAIERAKVFIANNTAAFEGVVEESPFFKKPSDDSEKKTEESAYGEKPSFIHDPFGTFYN